MCVHVNSLPNDCLLPVFDNIPLVDLLYIDQVCHRWADLITRACARRRTLVLRYYVPNREPHSGAQDFRIPFNATFTVAYNDQCGSLWEPLPEHERDATLNMPSLKHNPDDDADDMSLCTDPAECCITEMARFKHAQIAKESTHLVNYFAELLPKVSTLVVIHSECSVPELLTLVNMIDSKSATNRWSLKKLKLWLNVSEKVQSEYESHLGPDKHFATPLLQAIQQQASSLEQLSLDIASNDRRELTLPVELFSFIAQLKVLKLDLGNWDNYWDNLSWDAVHRFGGPKLRQVGLNPSFGGREKNLTNAFLDFAADPEFTHADFTAKVCQLYGWIGWTFESADKLHAMCLRFSSLTSLSMIWEPSITFTQLVFHLASLAQLVNLELELWFFHHPDNLFALVDGVECADAVALTLPQVKTLEFAIHRSNHHRNFESLSRAVFPSVRVLKLINYSDDCPSCPVHKKTFQFANKERELSHRLLVESLMGRFGASLEQLYATGRYKGHLYPLLDWVKLLATERSAAAAYAADAASQPKLE